MVKLEKEEIEIVQHKIRLLAAEVGADLQTIEAIVIEMAQEPTDAQ